MAKDFSSKQGGIQPSDSTGRDPKESGVPKTGFDEAPAGTVCQGEAGPGVGNSRKGIH
jgi:hypothetical protein